jgi:hypothetical protein
MKSPSEVIVIVVIALQLLVLLLSVTRVGHLVSVQLLVIRLRPGSVDKLVQYLLENGYIKAFRVPFGRPVEPILLKKTGGQSIRPMLYVRHGNGSCARIQLSTSLWVTAVSLLALGIAAASAAVFALAVFACGALYMAAWITARELRIEIAEFAKRQPISIE